MAVEVTYLHFDIPSLETQESFIPCLFEDYPVFLICSFLLQGDSAMGMVM